MRRRIPLRYDCIIVGGGIAGLQAAIQLGRTEHEVLVIDSGYGRSTLCKSYRNVLGWPDGISGEKLRELGRMHAERLGVRFVVDEVVRAMKQGEFFVLNGKGNDKYESHTLLLATGLLDRFPPLPGLVPCLGLTVFVCPDCDGYEVRDRKTIVLGSGEVGARMAIALLERTRDLVFVNHERKSLKSETAAQLKAHNIAYYEEVIERVVTAEEGRFQGVKLNSGTVITGERGFIAFGDNKIRSELAEQLGIERMENKHTVADPRTKMTQVQNVWAAGDIGVHSEQVTIAMGEGQLAAIWIHKALTEMKHKVKVSSTS